MKLIWKNSVINHKHIKQINHKQPTQYTGAAEPTTACFFSDTFQPFMSSYSWRLI